MEPIGQYGPVQSLCSPHCAKPSPTPPATVDEAPHFAQFSRLPVELRFKIWEEALVVERVLILRTNFDFRNDWTEEVLYFEGKERSPAIFCSCKEPRVSLFKFKTYHCANNRHAGCRNRKYFVHGFRDILYLRKLSSKSDITSLHYALVTDVIHPMSTKIRMLAIDFRTDAFEEMESLTSVPYFFRHLELLMVIVGNNSEIVTQKSDLFELKITRITKRGRLELDWCELRREHGRVCKVPSVDVRESMLEILLSLARSFTYFKEFHTDWKMPKIKFMGVQRGKEGSA